MFEIIEVLSQAEAEAAALTQALEVVLCIRGLR